MKRPGDWRPAAGRALWLAELSAALDHAQLLASSILVADGHRAEFADVRDRLTVVRLEVDALRRGRWHSLEAGIEPEWHQLLSRSRPDDSSSG